MNFITFIINAIADFNLFGRPVVDADGIALTAEQIANERDFITASGINITPGNSASYVKLRRVGRPFAMTRKGRLNLFDLLLTAEDNRIAGIQARNARIAELSTPEMTRIINGCLPDAEYGIDA